MFGIGRACALSSMGAKNSRQSSDINAAMKSRVQGRFGCEAAGAIMDGNETNLDHSSPSM